MTEEYVLRVPAKLEGMDVILAFVSYLLDINGCSTKTRTQLRIAIEELYVNVTLYAYPDGNGWAEIRGSIEDGVATFTLIDSGRPFDPLAKEDPDTMLSGEDREMPGHLHGEEHDGRDGIRIPRRLQPADDAQAALSWNNEARLWRKDSQWQREHMTEEDGSPAFSWCLLFC